MSMIYTTDTANRMKATTEFLELINTIKGRRVGIVPHTHADLDSVCSAIALRSFINEESIAQVDILYQDAPTDEVKRLEEMIEKKYGKEHIPKNTEDKEWDNYDGFILLDTNSYELAPKLKNRVVFGTIDHHNTKSKDVNTKHFIFLDVPALSQLMYYLILENPSLPNYMKLKKYEEIAALCLSIGITSDTARFKSGSPDTFEVLADLIRKSKTEYKEILALAEPYRDISSRISILSSLKKMNYVIVNNYIIATSEASHSESDIATVLTEGIAHVSFVARWVNEEKSTRISARASTTFPISLVDIIIEVANALGGKGGGHPKAAGARVPTHSDIALEQCIETTTNKIAKRC